MTKKDFWNFDAASGVGDNKKGPGFTSLITASNKSRFKPLSFACY